MPDSTQTNPPQQRIKEAQPEIGRFTYWQRNEDEEYEEVERDAIVKDNDLKVTGITVPVCDLIEGEPKIIGTLFYLCDYGSAGTQYSASCTGNKWSVLIPGDDLPNAALYCLRVFHRESSGHNGIRTEQFTPIP